MSFALGFIGAELEEEGLGDDAEFELEEIRRALPEMEEFVAERERQIADEIAAARAAGEAVLACPSCLEEALICREGLRCAFCGYAVGLNRIEDKADSWVSEVLGLNHYRVVTDGGEWPVSRCPNCALVALIDRDDDADPDQRFVCLACGIYWSDRELEECAICGERFAGEGTVCMECFQARVAE